MSNGTHLVVDTQGQSLVRIGHVGRVTKAIDGQSTCESSLLVFLLNLFFGNIAFSIWGVPRTDWRQEDLYITTSDQLSVR